MDAEPDPLLEPMAHQGHASFDAAASPHTLYARVEFYPWSEDQDFQLGLAAILGPSSSSSPESQIKDLTLRARCFYFARKYGLAIEFDGYKGWRASQPTSSLSSLAPSTVTESSVPPTSTQTPLWQQPDKVSLPQELSSREIRTTSTNGDDASLMATNMFDNLPTKPSPEALHARTQSQEIAQPSYPSSFEEVMHLIQNGQPIPGIKEIPDTVLIGQGTIPTRNKRRKPWESNQNVNLAT